MIAWWQSLSIDQQIFAAIALVGTAVLAMQILLMLIGVEHGDFSIGDADAGGPGDHASGLGFLSLRSLVAFAVGFGWTGLGLSRADVGMPITIGGSLLVGVLMMATVVMVMRSLTRFTYSGSLDYRNAIGQTGTVYATIPPAQTAAGQVEVLVQGRYATVQAMTKAADPIAPRAKVTIVALVDRTTLLVEPLS